MSVKSIDEMNELIHHTINFNLKIAKEVFKYKHYHEVNFFLKVHYNS